jgi:putative hydrolase of the HAD superfamily
MNFDLNAIRNIIFDLGDVIYDIDPVRFQQAIYQLSQRCGTSERVQSQGAFRAIVHQYERGELSTPAFRERLRKEYFPGASDPMIDQMWNSMLIGVFPDRKSMLQRFRRRFRLFFLSNTNELHYEAIRAEMQPLEALVEHTYLSHDLGTRKPEPAIFQQVLAHAGLRAQETLLIDDVAQNVEAARGEGLHAYQLTEPAVLQEVLQAAP